MNQSHKINQLYQVIKKYHQEYIKNQEITVYGYQFNYPYQLIGSVNQVYFPPLIIKEALIPMGNPNRPGQKIKQLEYIVVHDTASSAPTAGSTAHKNYVTSPDCKVSWHYSVGDDLIYHHIPDDEIGYHAGDGTQVEFSLTKTSVQALDNQPLADVKIVDQMIYLNNQPTMIKLTDLPLSDLTINDQGIRTEIIDGYYQIGPIYYNNSYKLVANRGGNLHSIGMETMINQGSNLYHTWMITSKLCQKLLVEHNLPLAAIKPHHFFSGKNCPMTIRQSDNWNHLISLIATQLEYQQAIGDLEVKFESLSEYLDDFGIITKIPQPNTVIKYQVTITDRFGTGQSQTFQFQSLFI